MLGSRGPKKRGKKKACHKKQFRAWPPKKKSTPAPCTEGGAEKL